MRRVHQGKVGRTAFSSMDETSAPEMWERLDQLMAQIAHAKEPYTLGTQVGECVLDAITESVIASRTYQLWAGLTDRYELRPGERGETEVLMRRAASE